MQDNFPLEGHLYSTTTTKCYCNKGVFLSERTNKKKKQILITADADHIINAQLEHAWIQGGGHHYRTCLKKNRNKRINHVEFTLLKCALKITEKIDFFCDFFCAILLRSHIQTLTIIVYDLYFAI